MTLTIEKNKLFENIKQNIEDVDEDDMIEHLVKKALDMGIDARDIIKIISESLEEVGRLYNEKEYFLAEMIRCGSRAINGIEIVKPLIQDTKQSFSGTIVFGTVKGDIHSLGKTITSAFLTGAGFIIHDLGEDVPASAFCDAIERYDADILAMSTLLSSCLPEIENAVREVEERGLRARVKIIVGGRATDVEFAKRVNVDAWADQPSDSIAKCKQLMKEKK